MSFRVRSVRSRVCTPAIIAPSDDRGVELMNADACEATIEALLLESHVARGRVAGSHLHRLDFHEPKITHDPLLLLRLFQPVARLVKHEHLINRDPTNALSLL